MTAVEWLEDNIDREMPYREILMLIKQAKEMEKQQIQNAHGDEQSKLQDDGSWKRQTAEQYYNETFKPE